MNALSQAAQDVLAERQRQIYSEGWTSDHDDEHQNGELAFAAACYAHHASARAWVLALPDGADSYRYDESPDEWPDSWDTSWWRPKNPRRDLVRAAALLLAEIERIDRAASMQDTSSTQSPQGGDCLSEWYAANPAPSMSQCATQADYWKAMYEHREREAHELSEEIIRLKAAPSAISPPTPSPQVTKGGE